MSHHEPLVTIGPDAKDEEEHRLRERMARIRRRLVVVSGKGGVGKSTAAANLAIALTSRGHRVGLLDVDIHGPSIPKIMGCEGVSPSYDGQSILPVEVRDRLALMSIGFLIGNKTDAVIWRGPVKYKVIQQFLFLFGTGGGERLSQEMSVPFLGRIPIDPRIVGCGDTGSCLLEAHPESPSAQSYFSLADRLHEQEDLWSGAAAAAPASREALP